MSADRCPRCGTARTAGGCACPAASPVEQTELLPPLDGPQLVRPYVAGTPVVDAGDPSVDPFATRVGPPPVQPITGPQAGPAPFAAPQPPARPPHVPQAASPFGPPQPAAPAQPLAHEPFAPQPDAAATRLLPPVPPQGPPAPEQSGPAGAPEQGVPFTLGRVVPPPQAEQPTALIPPVPAGPEPATALLPPVPAEDAGAIRPLGAHPQDGSEPPGRPAPADLGMFAFRGDDEAAPVSRADRRSQRRQSADRKRLVIAGGAVGVTALGASLAMLLSSSPTKVDKALPAPTAPSVVSSASATPSAPPSTDASPTASATTAGPSPVRTTARPTQTVTTHPAVTPTTAAPPAPTSAPPTQPSSPPAFRTLRLNDTGPEVTQLQRLLMAYRCDMIGPLDTDRTNTDPRRPGFGSWTQSVLSTFQIDNRKSLPGVQRGVYDQQTQALLQTLAQNPDC
ncbi:hypothetical protein ACFV1L_28115 [Kitasatospora sp. NPDC059646]|uniref:hypothetical protein n=1 Tax=Kitasatospora sp. NPDC059646 TaxID=3346893 RepID=UPI00369271FB